MRLGAATLWRAICNTSGMKKEEMTVFRRRARIALCTTLLGLSAMSAATSSATVPIDAATSESRAAIREAAENVIRGQLRGSAQTVYVHAVDPDARLHLPRCVIPLTASLLSGMQLGPRTEVRVSCTAQISPWAVFVPVSIESDVNVLVLREGAVRGARLTADQVVSETRHMTGLPVGYITDVQGLQRYTLARSLPPGAPLTSDAMIADYVVRQGQEVTLIASGPGISVRATGRVLQDGREGALVRVQNLASQKVVQGVVDPSGTIQVTP